MKKRLALFLVAFLVFGFGSCKKQNKEDASSASDSTSSEVESNSETPTESEKESESEQESESKPTTPEPHGPEGSHTVSWYIAGKGSIFSSDWDISKGVTMFNNPANPNDKACVLSVPFAVGDKFKIVDSQNNLWFGYEVVNKYDAENNAGLKAFGPADDGYNKDKFNIECLISGLYDIYVESSGTIWIDYCTL